MDRRLSSFLIIVVFVFIADCIYAELNLTLFNADDYTSPATHRMIDNDTGEHIQTGSLVQLIWTGPNGVMDTVNTDNFQPAGDDQLLQFDFNASDGSNDAIVYVGTGYAEEGEGRLIVDFPFINLADYDPNSNPENIKVYVRFFNVSDPVESKNQGFPMGSINWGESKIFSLPSPDMFGFGELDFAPDGPLYTTHTLYESQNKSPQASAGGPYLGSEGTEITLDASNTIDPDESNLSLIFEWDLDCDGQYDDAEGMTPAFTWDDDADIIISLKVTDSADTISYSSARVLIQNIAPVLNGTKDKTINEGEFADFSMIYSDAGTEDSHTVTINWGNDENIYNIPVSNGLIEFSHKYLYSGNYKVCVYLYDDDGAKVEETFYVAVKKIPVETVISLESNGNIKLNWNNISGREYKIFYCDRFEAGVSWFLANKIIGGNYIDCGDSDGYDNILGTEDDRLHPSGVLIRLYKIE